MTDLTYKDIRTAVVVGGWRHNPDGCNSRDMAIALAIAEHVWTTLQSRAYFSPDEGNVIHIQEDT